MGMWNILEQILLLGGAIGSMAGGIVAIVTYLQNKKTKEPPSIPSPSGKGGYFLTGRASAKPTHPHTYRIP